MARPSNTAARRAQIIDGLKTVMAERGYERASIAAIAEAAGLASGLVHYHFANKAEILVGLIAALEASFLARDAARQTQDPWGDLDAFINALTALDQGADPEGIACWVAIGALAHRWPQIGEVYRAVVHRQHRELTRRVAVLTQKEAAPIAAMILATIEGAFRLAIAAPEVIEPGTAAGMVRQMARGLIKEA